MHIIYFYGLQHANSTPVLRDSLWTTL